MPAELILHRLRTTEVDVEPDVRLIVLGPETEESDPPQDATVATVVKAARTKKATLIGVRFMSGSCPVKESKPKPAMHQRRPPPMPKRLWNARQVELPTEINVLDPFRVTVYLPLNGRHAELLIIL